MGEAGVGKMQILRIKAFLHLAGEAGDQHQEFDATGPRVRWTTRSNTLREPFNAALQNGFSYVLFMGCNIDSHRLLEFLMDSRPPLGELKVLKTVESLATEEVSAINKERQTEPCPPGTYFTGTHWVNFYGEPTFEHPCLPDFLEEFVQESNKEFVAHNAIVEKEWADAAAQAAMCYVERDGVREPLT